ncbi:phage gp6-like head-tail connector protein [Levilactobacillus brevis]|uniref:head-tail connector protein n=1 Tax=Levilactobacillus brevis TaxID=1580 RepID=UPI0021A6AE10|nr:head-tail connector protein [Levilactobacillus brevis]MCT3589318.1 phage gp6-like head-tail connector protein [Levilactobacillus brevis]
MAVTLEQLKNSLRIDGSADDGMLSGYLTAAQSYIQNAVGTDVADFYTAADVASLYDVAVLALASSYYNVRSSLVSTTTISVNLPVDSIIGQLRGLYAKREEELDGESN